MEIHAYNTLKKARLDRKQIWKKVPWADESKIALHQKDERRQQEKESS